MNSKINQIQNIFGCCDTPQNRVKVEKKDKGLFTKTDESTILLTEDNKMVLND